MKAKSDRIRFEGMNMEIMDRISDGIVAFDSNLNYTYLNEAAGILLGRSPESLVGKNYWDEFPEAKGSRFANAYVQALATQKMITLDDYFEPWDRWFANKIYPSASGLTIFFYETTEQKKIELALRESEKHLRKIIDNLPVGVAVNKIFPAVEFVHMNKLFSEFYCVKQEDILAPDSFWEVVYEDPVFREEIKKKILDGISSGDPERFEWAEVPVTRGGEVVRYITAKAIPVPESNLIVSTVTDETARVKNAKALTNIEQRYRARLEKQVEERTKQLVAANKELEAFSYSVSHDLRAPLRAISGFSRILNEDHGEQLGDEGKRVCKIITDNALRMSQLIDDLLQFSRLSRKDLALSPIDMQTMLNSIYHEVTTPEQREKIAFLEDPIHKCYGDPNMMRQVWTNLLSNAVKFSSKKENPVISVWSDLEEGEIRYYVKDNGVGFDMRYSEKLFGVFQRLHGINEFDGTGVGLALVQRIIHKHGGWVKGTSELGKGATFSFAVPANEADVISIGEKWKII